MPRLFPQPRQRTMVGLLFAGFSLMPGLCAGEAAPPPGSATATKPTLESKPTESRPDPTAVVVVEGAQIFRQRDIDALILISQRHAKGKLGGADLERMRSVIVRALAAREKLLVVLADLPTSLTAKAREGLILDLLDYQGEINPKLRKAALDPVIYEAPAPAGPLMVRLPPLPLYRMIAGNRRQLTVGLALYFANPAIGKRMEDQSPLIQDAILAQLQRLSDAEFLEPSHASLKQGLAKAIIAKVPGFPSDGVLITQLDPGDAAPGK